jgi:HK97 family phage major capsid protein
LGYAIEQAIDAAFFAGDATSTYGGISGISGTAFPSGAKGLVSAASGHSALSSIDNTDFGTLISTLPAAFHDNATFVMHPVAWGQLCIRLAATAGAPLVDEAGRRAFAGYPVVLTGSMPSATTSLTGKIVLAFGDFRRCSMLGIRRDTNIAYSPNRYFDIDQLGIRATARYDVVHHGVGDSSNADAVVALVGG